MDIFASLFNFFSDSSRNITHKTLITFATIVTLLFIDNTLNFSTHYNYSRKLEQIETINRILKDSLLTNKEQNLLKLKKSQLLTSKTWKDNIYDYIFSFDFKSMEKTIPNKLPEDISKDTNNENVRTQPDRHYWIHFISSGWTFVIIYLIMLVAPFFGSSTTNIYHYYLGYIFSYPIFFFFIWIFAWMFSFIPVIHGNPIYNYIINFILHGCIILIIVLFVRNYEKRSKY